VSAVVEDTRTVAISQAVVNAMIAHAQREAPKECCGLLVGSAGRVDENVATRNIAGTPETRYEVDPREHIALNRTLRGSGREVVGVYHSHPRGPARPSPTDVAEAFYPDFIYVIVSMEQASHADVRAFEIVAGQANELTIVHAPILRSFRSS